MNKRIKYIAIALIGIFSSFVLSSKLETEPDHETTIAAPVKIDSTIVLEEHPKALTSTVHYKLDSLLKRINKRHDFHGAMLVAKNGKIVYNNQIGVADFKKKSKLNKESVFQLASVSKQFTAAAIMLLYERAQLQLTDTVNIFFPGFPYEHVTIKNLLNHTAGLPKYFWLAEHKWMKESAPTNMEMMDLMEKVNVQRFFKPGRNFDYSNTGYMVLASIVEKVSGMRFGEFLKKEFFNPLGMENTYVYSFENDQIKNNQLVGYRLYRGWRHISIGGTVNDAVVGDKNVYSTSDDLFKWTIGLNTGKILSRASIDMMYTKGETVYGRQVPYGFGFRIDTKEQNTIYHHGKWNGFSTALMQYPEEDLVVIILEHTSYNAMTSLNKKVKKIVTENFGV